MSERVDVSRYLHALFEHAPAASLVELRWRAGTGMGRDFFHADRHLDRAARAILRQARRTDVYVGVLPRRRPGGGRADLFEAAAVLWADCDSPSAVSALQTFTPHPSIIVASGTAGHLHAYWLLPHPVALVEIESANRRLARALGADASCADAARIMRPPSWNHKATPPTPVQLVHVDPCSRAPLAEVVPTGDDDEIRPPAREPRRDHDDPLLSIAPAVYVEALAGLAVPRSRKVACPFHADDTPSLHVYDEPERGWYCYGCRRGGSVYDFGAEIFGMRARGTDFRLLQQRLDEQLSPLVDLTIGA